MDISGRVVMDYDPKENILTIRYPESLVLDSEATIDALCAHTLQKLQGIRRRVYVLVDDTGISIDLRLLDYFDQAFAPCLAHIRATTRYGQVDSPTRAAVTHRARGRRDTTNIYPTRELALAALRQIIAYDSLRHRAGPSS
jgi:hypothetical protein